MNRDEILLTKLVVEKGWLTEKDVQACLREQQGDKNATVGRKVPRPLGVVMVARGFITDEQLIRLMEEVRKSAGAAASSTGSPARRLLGQILVDLGAASQDQIRDALDEQQRLNLEGKAKRIGEILVEKGYARPGDISAALKEQDKTVVACIGCAARYNVVYYKPWLEYRCRKCGALLDLAQEMIRADETVGMRIPPGQEDKTPQEVRAASDERKRQFGKFILVNEITEGDFGTLYRCWKKDTQSYAGLVLLEGALDSEALARLFSHVRQGAIKVGVTVGRMVEMSEHDGRHYLCVTIS